MADDKSLKHDALVSRIVGDPAKPADTIWLTGFLGPSSEDGHTRVYSDPSFETYVDVPTDAIIHTEPLPKDQSPLGGSYVWLKKDAEVLHGKVGTERKKAKFLEGPIQAAFAAQAGAAAPGGGVGILPTDNPGCGPTRFPPQCQSPNLLGCLSPLPHCPPPSDFVRCPSPNLLGCQSPLPHCQSAVDACPTRIPQFCHTHFPAYCPSQWEPCPTQHPHPCPSFAPSPCPPSPPPLLCPRTPWPQHCLTLPFCPTETCPSPQPQCFQPITVNNQQCVASGGGPGCPVLPGQPVEGQAGIQAFAAGPGIPQPPSLAPFCGPSAPPQFCVSPQPQLCPPPFTAVHCPPSPPPLFCPHTPWPHLCPSPWQPHCPPSPPPLLCPITPHCPPTPFHGPCPSPYPLPCPPSPPPLFCISPQPQLCPVTPFCPVSPQCPISPGCPITVNCPVSPNCPPATPGCPFGPGGGGGPQF